VLVILGASHLLFYLHGLFISAFLHNFSLFFAAPFCLRAVIEPTVQGGALALILKIQ
jgi:hypothetical protein